MSRKSELIAKHSEISLVISDELSATGIRNLLRPDATSCAVSAVATRFMVILSLRCQKMVCPWFIEHAL